MSLHRRRRKPPRPDASPVWGADVPELCPREPVPRWAITKRRDKASPAPRGAPPRFLYGWIAVAPNFRVIEVEDQAVILNARDEVDARLDGEFVEFHRDLQEAKVACSRYNSVQSVLES